MYKNFKSKTGITLCIIYMIFTIFCVAGFSHRTDLGSVVALLPTLPVAIPVLYVLDFAGVNIRPVSWWLDFLFIFMTTIFFYFMGYWIEKTIKTISAKNN